METQEGMNEMECPHCGEDLLIHANSQVVWRNVETYGRPARARTACCDKIVVVRLRTSFDVDGADDADEDDWGN